MTTPAPPSTANRRPWVIAFLALMAFIASLPSEPVDLHRPARPLPWAGLEVLECGP